MSAQSLVRRFSVADRVLKRNLEGLTQADSLVEPQPGGNCLNWVLGHMLATRNSALKLLGREPVCGPDQAALYNRKLEPGELRKLLPLEALIADWDRSQATLLAALEVADESVLARPLENPTFGQTVEQGLDFLHFHEAYHLGQIGLLRRIAGKPGAISRS